MKESHTTLRPARDAARDPRVALDSAGGLKDLTRAGRARGSFVAGDFRPAGAASADGAPHGRGPRGPTAGAASVARAGGCGRGGDGCHEIRVLGQRVAVCDGRCAGAVHRDSQRRVWRAPNVGRGRVDCRARRDPFHHRVRGRQPRWHLSGVIHGHQVWELRGWRQTRQVGRPHGLLLRECVVFLHACQGDSGPADQHGLGCRPHHADGCQLYFRAMVGAPCLPVPCTWKSCDPPPSPLSALLLCACW